MSNLVPFISDLESRYHNGTQQGMIPESSPSIISTDLTLRLIETSHIPRSSYKAGTTNLEAVLHHFYTMDQIQSFVLVQSTVVQAVAKDVCATLSRESINPYAFR